MSKQTIDIEKAIQSKNPGLLKWLPAFVLNYIKKVTHESWLNSILERHGHLKGMDFVNAVIEEMELEVELEGAEQIPKTGGVIIAANHPLGGLDGVALMYALGKIRTDIRFLVNDLLMTFDNFEPIFVPVNKHGKNSQGGLAKIEEVYANDYAVLIFPAGLVSRKSPTGIRDLQWKKSFISKSKKYKKDILLSFIDGKNSNFFYNLANWRKKLGVKVNLEMFYLVDEMYKQRGRKVTIRMGERIPYQSFTSDKTDSQWADIIKEKVYELGSQNGKRS